jgi:ribose 5-phosphate isomerase RpiB
VPYNGRTCDFVDAELVNRIVKEVLAALGQAPPDGRRSAVSPAGPGATRAGEMKPPPAGAPRPATLKSKTPPTRQPPAKSFLTADAVKRRLAGASDKHTLELAWNEVLTPNAEDFAQCLHLTIKRSPRPAIEPAGESVIGRGGAAAGKSADSSRSSPSPAPVAGVASMSAVARPASSSRPTAASRDAEARSLAAPAGLLLHRADDKVAGLVAGLAREGSRLVDFGQGDCVLRNLESLCEAIGAGRVARGVVIAPHGAGLLALAGKCAGVRPVQATRPASVEAALRQFGANLLVVEHAFSTFHEIRTMVRLFLSAAESFPTDKALADALARLDAR